MDQGPVRRIVARLASVRVSILTRIVAVLVAVIAASVLVTNVLEARLTTSVLAVESEKTVQNHLNVLQRAFSQSEQLQDVTLRTYAELIFAQGLLDQPNELEATLGRLENSLRLDLLSLVDSDKNRLAGTGVGLDFDMISWPPGSAPFPRTRLVTGDDGLYYQIQTAPVGSHGLTLVAGKRFDASFAYLLRGRLGGAGEVILLADDEVVGETLVQELDEPPGMTDKLPRSAVSFVADGTTRLVAYEDLVSAPGLVRATVGVALTDPVAPLTAALERVRLLTSAALVSVAIALGWLLFRSITRPLVGLSETADRIAKGDLDAQFSTPRNDEVARLAAALDTMTVALKISTRRLQSAAKRVMLAQEEERKRMARDLHDGMQQRLLGLAVKLRRAELTDPRAADLGLKALAADAEDAAFTLQEIGRGIYPSVLADQGLGPALRSSAGRLPMSVTIEVADGADDVRLSPEVEGSIYYVALEIMNNAQKHAPTAHLRVLLELLADRVVLTVEDDGPGFDSSEAGPGSGLQGIVDRISAVGGTVQIDSRPGEGTRICLEVPVDVRRESQVLPDSRR